MVPRPSSSAASDKKKGGALKQGNLFSFFSKKTKPAATNAKQQQQESSTANNKKPAVAAQPPKPQTKKKKKRKYVASEELLSQVVVGNRIEVFWEDDNEWYEAKVAKHREGHTYFLEYDDGQCENLDLSCENFRLVHKSRKKRRIQLDDDSSEEEEAEFGEMEESSDEESAYKDEDAKNNDDEEDEDDQWMVTDDEDDQEVVTEMVKKKPKKKQAAAPPRKAVSSLGNFAAGTVTVTHHAAAATASGKKTPNSNDTKAATPKQITPGTGLLKRTSSSSFSQPSPPAFGDSNNSTAKQGMVIPPQQPGPPAFVPGALNPAGSHVHNHLTFLQNPVDSAGRARSHPDYDARTLKVVERDWMRINSNKKMTDAVKQWWDLKSQYFDTVLLFKTGKFYEMFHMDADIGVQVCGLSYMKGHLAHAGFPEVSYGPMADKLVRAGYKVARVEQTETPEQLKERKKKHPRGSAAPKVVNREVCSIMTLGTRTFCYLDDNNALLEEASGADAPVGPLLVIREILLESDDDANVDDKDDDENVQPVCEYGITLIDAVRGSVTLGQFADDVLRSRMVTLLAAFSPSEILVQGGENGASPTLHSLLLSLQTTSQQNFRVETIMPTESFPKSTAIDANIRKQLERGNTGGRNNNCVQPWDVEETLTELHRRKYYPRASKQDTDRFSVKRWPKVLRAAVEGKADLALSSFGAALYYLQRNLIDAELLSMGIVKAYIPPESCAATEQTVGEMHQLAYQQNMQESGLDEQPTEVSGQSVGQPIQFDHADSSESNQDITHMSVDGTTLHNLEILTNSVDHKTTGSLWSKINYTKTPHGSRLLRAWLLRPLFRKADIERRVDAVQELVSGGAAVALKEARSVLAKCGDIERLLSRVHSMSGTSGAGDDEEEERIHPNQRAILYETATYTKRKVGDFSKVLNGLRCAAQIPELFNGIEIESGLLRKIVQFVDQGGCFPDMAEDLDWFFTTFDCDQAAKGLFEPTSGVDELYDDACATIERIVDELNAYKDEMCANFLTPKALARSSWKYANVKPDSKDKYLIELPANVAVPSDFIMKGKRGSGHKQINKYRTPVVEDLVKDLEAAYDLQKERKARGLELIFAKFDSMRNLWAAAAQATALLDALGSLAQVASKSGYTRPRILDCPVDQSPSIKIIQGRHPCVENVPNSSEFIPNDLSLGYSSEGGVSPRVLLLSGPNMGGKSTLLRQTCLIAILAQLGSFVPAAECEMTPIDRIFTRLGAQDRILLNQSTFFVELAETAAALRGATRRSLVIMDELGRGTSTFDGTAIASAAVKHLVERNKCLSLFATHYHSLLDEWKDKGSVLLGHMECLVEDQQESEDSNITFLYTLGAGTCPKSFGINVARLAGLPDNVLEKAKRISTAFEQEMNSAESSRALVRASNAPEMKRRIKFAVEAGNWDEVHSLWQSFQEYE